MPKLPGPQDLGPIPTADVVGVDTSALKRGAADIAQGGQRLGLGIQAAGQGMADIAIDRTRWQYAMANSGMEADAVTTDANLRADNTYGPDASGKTMQDRYADAAADSRDKWASTIDDPGMRQRFVAQASVHVAQINAAAASRARDLGANDMIATTQAMGDKLINQAVAAPDDATRTRLIDSHNQLVDGLASSGAITPVQALGMKKGWAKQYAAANVEAAIDSNDPARIDAARNVMRLPPGSGADITNRIIQVEGSGKNPGSSATGVGQFTDTTWLDVLKRNRPDLAQGRSDADLLALRADKSLARDMTEAYRAENAAYLTRQGLEPTPGAQYLAHFLGPGGAAAVLKANPNAPVADVLAKAVGADRAADMIAANPTVLSGQLVGSVKQWADAKMGGTGPGAGSIYDTLDPATREDYALRLDAAARKIQVQGRAAFAQRVDNATSEALNTGTVTKPLTQADFIGEYGAANGPAEFAKYDTAVQLGRTVAGMATMTPAQRQATVASLQPQPGDPNFALKQNAHDVAARAAASIEKNLKQDPAGFAVAKLTASKDAYAAFSAAVTSPNDATRAAAAQNYAATVAIDQERAGVAPDAQAVLPKSYVDHFNATLQKTAASDSPQARVALIGQVQREARMWGGYWPMVMRQLAPATQPVVRAIAAGADPAAMTRLLSLDPKEKPADVLKEQDAVKSADLTRSLDTAMAPFLGTLVGRQRDRDFPGYYNLATTLGALYVRDGMSADDAAAKAFRDVVGGQYDFRDSFRVPKSAGISADDVQAGAQWARARLGALGAAPLVADVPGADPQTDLRDIGRDGKWVTAPDNSGLNLAYRDEFVRGRDGQRLTLSWARLAGLATAARQEGAPDLDLVPGL